MGQENKILEKIVDNTPVLMAYLDNEFNFVRVNKAYAEADDKEMSFFKGKNHFDLYPNEENQQIFQNVVNSGEPFFIRGKPFKYPKNPERGITYWDWSLIPIKEDGKVTGLAFTLRDVTEREETLIKLEKSYDTINFYKDLIAHDMANILSAIQTSSELLEKYEKGKLEGMELSHLTKVISKQVQKGDSLIENVQKLTQLEKEEPTIKIELKEILKELISQIQNQFSKEHIEFVKDFPDDPIYVEGGKLLYDAFENILMNSIIYNTSEIKKIWINLTNTREEGKEYAKVEVLDNGIGIPDSKKGDIFKRGFKSSDSKGMGLGLSLVKKIVERYNGRITVKDRIQGDYTQGASFTILLNKSAANSQEID